MSSYRNTNLSSTAQEVKDVWGLLTWIHVFNGNNADSYLQFYDSDSDDVTVGTTTPRYTLWIPAYGSHDIQFSRKMVFNSGITVAATTTPTGNTAPSNGLLVDIDYE